MSMQVSTLHAKTEDWRTLSLDAGGRSLIEASAGTGKTWTISVLYLRLLLEQTLSPRQIVVTTFTDAAAEELRERIRAQLIRAERYGRQLQAVGVQSDGAEPADLQWLYTHWTAAEADAEDKAPEDRIASDINRLRLAQAELDLAPISTLHGLCRKILSDFPFESGSAFGLGEMVSSESMMQTLAEDVWRQQTQTSESGQPALDVTSIDTLKNYLKAYSAPGVSVRLRALDVTPEVALSVEWVEPIRQLVGRKVFRGRATKLKNALTQLADYLESQPRDPGLLPTKLDNLVPEPVSDQIGEEHLDDSEVQKVLAIAADAAQTLEWLAAEHRIAAWHHWVEQIKTWREQRLTASGQITFDELIERVARALPEGGSALADSLFKAWPVALVDEFQDTDALQYGILDRIYRDSTGEPRGRLVMIGDPKQAIYRFRGGDIHAYLKARSDAGSRLSLDTNYRSSRAMVAASNAFYELAGAQLSTDADHAIRYEAVKASARCDDAPYEVDGQPCTQPLQLHYWADCPDDAESRRSAALKGCANQIVELLKPGKHSIGGKPLVPGDIAVLVPGNNDIIRLRRLLNDRNVPCVSSARSSVFESDWARELQIVLYAAQHPRDEGAVHAALATRLGGKTYEDLRTLRDQPEHWQALSAGYVRLGEIWKTRGVLALIQELTRQATPRLFAAGDSERSLTDLRHLGELLQTASETFAGPEQLLGWLAEERGRRKADDGDAADEMRLRIESDAARVRLMTVHASKGLEFPVVMLPLMWANTQVTKDTIQILHDAESGERIPGFGEADKTRYRQEGQDERFRLLYVALTRARYACHVYVLPPGRAKDKKGGAADTDPHRAPLDGMIERMLPKFDVTASQASLHEHIVWNANDWAWPEGRYQPPVDTKPVSRVALSEPHTTAFEFKWSFTSLTKSQTRIASFEDGSAADESEQDAGEPIPLPSPQSVPGSATPHQEPPATGIARGARQSMSAGAAISGQPHPASGRGGAAESTPEPNETPRRELLDLVPIAGADFGNALHAMFEFRQIGQPMSAQHDLIRHHLLDSGVRLGEIDLETLVRQLAHRIQTTLDTPMALADGHTVRLGDLPREHLRAEMGFDYVLDGVTMQRLRDACARAGEPDLVPKASPRYLRGMMNGKIDLVFQHDNRFYVLDYKGNRLGEAGLLSPYAPAQLDEAMDRSHYRFQALLYVVAVDRYLRQRIGPGYDRSAQLGEAIYLFVRAVGLAPGAGIWARRFSDGLIDAIDAALAGREQEAA
ncbi:UvrD-helicase domain-containing protein [Lysobacter sp. A289]